MNIIFIIIIIFILIAAAAVMVIIFTKSGPPGSQGVQGDQGPAGSGNEQGPVGPPGPPGIQGVQGIAGPQGSQGRDGSYTPSSQSIQPTKVYNNPGTGATGTFSITNQLMSTVTGQQLIFNKTTNLTLSIFYSNKFVPGFSFIVSNNGDNNMFLILDNSSSQKDSDWNYFGNPNIPRAIISPNTSVLFTVVGDSSSPYLTMISGLSVFR